MGVTDSELKRILEAAEKGIRCLKADFGLPGDAALDKCKENGWVEFREHSALYDESGKRTGFTAAPSGYVVLTEAGERELARLRSLQ